MCDNDDTYMKFNIKSLIILSQWVFISPMFVAILLDMYIYFCDWGLKGFAAGNRVE